MTCDDVKPLLHARHDGELDAVQRAAVDSHVSVCVACAKDVEEMESLRQTVRAGLPYFHAPEGLKDRVRFALKGAANLERPPQQPHWKLWGAAAAALFFILSFLPFLVNARNQRRLVAEELLSAHQRSLLGRGLDVISSDRHNVKPWFDGRVPFSPPVGNLASHGFLLLGGRVDYVDGHPVAAIVYGRRLHRIDLFVWPSAHQNTPLSHFERNGFNEISWMKDDFLFTAVSDLNAAELAAFRDLLR